jgi:Amt family ammonium transporter
LFFQTVFAATAAIVSVLLLKNKIHDLSDILFMMTLLIYPISGSWVWNAGGWRKWGLLILPVQV